MGILSPASCEILDKALRAQPGREICGFLLSDRQQRQQVFLLHNWSGESDAFYIAECEIRRAQRYTQRERLKVEAFIHSHGTSLELSDGDRTSFRKSHLPWVIVLLTNTGLRFRVYNQ